GWQAQPLSGSCYVCCWSLRSMFERTRDLHCVQMPSSSQFLRFPLSISLRRQSWRLFHIRCLVCAHDSVAELSVNGFSGGQASGPDQLLILECDCLLTSLNLHQSIHLHHLFPYKLRRSSLHE
ncbi:hypothetical protein PENTCL1PPCAC_7610, partial [Pristionchus entomophagus]